MKGRSDPGASAFEALTTVREALPGDAGPASAAAFMRGLTLGALLGAAIAGSAIWQRRERARRDGRQDDGSAT